MWTWPAPGSRPVSPGVPVMQLEIRNAVERDRLFYNAFGFAAGALIAIVFFRRLSFMIIGAGPPLIAIVIALGALGWFDFRLNMFLNVMTPLIMVISFSDSMQLTFAARDRLLQGQPKFEAFCNAMLAVGPACVLTHATAALSFVALQFSESNLIRTFGEAGLVATLIAMFAVLMLVPLLGILLVRKESMFAAEVKEADTGVNVLRRFCAWIAAKMVSRPGLYTLLSVVIVGSLGLAYENLEPRYRLADQVPDREQAVAASNRLDAKLKGANPIDVLIEFPKGKSLYDPETLATIAEVHATVEKLPGIANVWSPETLRRWLAEKLGKFDVATLKQYVDMLPEHLTRRFISAEQDAVLVSGRVPDVDASQLLPVIESLDQALDDARKKHPGYKIAVTGLSAIAARNSALMIKKLNRGLTIEFVFVAAFIGLAFRSWVVMLAAILPGIFPVVLSGMILWALGEGPSVRKRRGADGLVRIGPERHNSFPEPVAAGGAAGRGSGKSRRAGNRACRPAADSDVRGAGMRLDRHGFLRFTIAAPVWLAERVRHARGIGCGPVDLAADGHVLEQGRTPDGRQTVLPVMANKEVRSLTFAIAGAAVPADEVKVIKSILTANGG